MRIALAVMIILGLLSLLAGCPRDGGDDTTPASGASDVAAVDNAPAPVEATAEPTTEPPADQAAGEAADASAEGAAMSGEAIGMIDSRLEVDGIKMGIDVDKLMERYPPDGAFITSDFWTADGKTGMVGANDKVIPEVAEAAYFLNGQLVGFMKHDMVEEAVYNTDIEALTKKFGEPLPDPPQWAMDTSVFADYAPPTPEEQIRFAFWGDKDGRTVLLASYDIPNAYYMLWMFHADWFDKAVEETNNAMAAQSGGGLPPGVD
ncbi:hypothetical protein JW859_13655 [bacterium]|nr:hypothetical protein [bacterium]